MARMSNLVVSKSGAVATVTEMSSPSYIIKRWIDFVVVDALNKKNYIS